MHTGTTESHTEQLEHETQKIGKKSAKTVREKASRKTLDLCFVEKCDVVPNNLIEKRKKLKQIVNSRPFTNAVTAALGDMWRGAIDHSPCTEDEYSRRVAEWRKASSGQRWLGAHQGV